MANEKNFIRNGRSNKDKSRLFIVSFKKPRLDMYLENILGNSKYTEVQVIVIEKNFMDSIHRICVYREWMFELLSKVQNKEKTFFSKLGIKKYTLFEVHNLSRFFENEFIKCVENTFQKFLKKSLCSKGEVRLKPLINCNPQYLF